MWFTSRLKTLFDSVAAIPFLMIFCGIMKGVHFIQTATRIRNIHKQIIVRWYREKDKILHIECLKILKKKNIQIVFVIIIFLFDGQNRYYLELNIKTSKLIFIFIKFSQMGWSNS